MGRMTKFLHQQVTLERVAMGEDGKPKLDLYGQYTYEPALVVKCRKEPAKQIVSTSTGLNAVSTTRYFLDETSSISVGDRLDGHNVLEVREYWGNVGQLEGFEVYI